MACSRSCGSGPRSQRRPFTPELREAINRMSARLDASNISLDRLIDDMLFLRSTRQSTRPIIVPDYVSRSGRPSRVFYEMPQSGARPSHRHTGRGRGAVGRTSGERDSSSTSTRAADRGFRPSSELAPSSFGSRVFRRGRPLPGPITAASPRSRVSTLTNY